MPHLEKKEFDKAIAQALAQAKADGKSKTVSVGNALSVSLRGYGPDREGGSAVWLYHYRLGTTMRTKGLGSYPAVGLNDARKARHAHAAKVLADADATQTDRREMEATEPAIRARFAEMVESFLAVNAPTWKADSSEPRKYRHLQTGKLGRMWCDEIGKRDVEAELTGRWGHALASLDKYRMRIQLVIAHATAKGFRDENTLNPARKEIIKHLVQSPPKSKPHKAMKAKDIPALMEELAALGTPSARALAFTVLTAARTNETLDMDWRDLDLANAIWRVPEDKMKETVAHDVPLTAQAIALLGTPAKSGLVFGRMADDAMLVLLQSLRPVPEGDDPFTMHGMRAAFSGDWGAKHGWSLEMRNRALAHAVGTETDGSYNYDKLLEERRVMMQQWSDFATGSISAAGA